MNLPKPPNMATLGTMSDLGNDIYLQTEEDRVRLRKEAEDERGRREAREDGDRYSEMQRVNAPEVDQPLVQKKFRIEMRFSGTDDGGSEKLEWFYGTVTRLVNKKKRSVEITWDKSCLHKDDLRKTTNVLLINRWNDKVPVAGTWRQYIP